LTDEANGSLSPLLAQLTATALSFVLAAIPLSSAAIIEGTAWRRDSTKHINASVIEDERKSSDAIY
jgi:hypothetical protein